MLLLKVPSCCRNHHESVYQQCKRAERSINNKPEKQRKGNERGEKTSGKINQAETLNLVEFMSNESLVVFGIFLATNKCAKIDSLKAHLFSRNDTEP